MDFLFQNLEENRPGPCLSDVELKLLMQRSDHSRYGRVKRAFAREDLIHLRRGLYCLGREYFHKPLNLFELAFQIYGPSYISMESALSHHGWIPERVTIIQSVSLHRSRRFENSLGVFDYRHIPKKIFYAGVDASFIARPWTALADYVYLLKKDWMGIKPLIGSLRIEEEELQASQFEKEYEDLYKNYPSARVRLFLDGVRKDLKS